MEIKNEVLNDLHFLDSTKHFRVWEPFMKKYDCQRICEIGVRRGYNFEKMIEHGPKVAVAIDIWKRDGNMGRNDRNFTQEQLDGQHDRFKARVADRPFAQILREYSFDAVKRFPDNYFDLVYVDADHTYEGISRDIADWYPKVKRGKFLLGDDYSKHKTKTRVTFGVIEAVNEFARNNDLSFFVYPKAKWGIIKP